MQIRITDGNRGPKGTIHDVYLKVYSFQNWYVIPSSLGYHVDDSYINSDEEILYQHPDFQLERHEALPKGFTFICDKDCEEVTITNNNQAKGLLAKEW